MSSETLNFKAVLAIILLLIASTSSATVCVSHKLAPLRHACGIVVDSSSTPIPNAKVRILGGGGEVLAVQTEKEGKFDFPHLDAGKYEIEVSATNFGTVSYAIVIANPDPSCKKTLRVQLALGTECPDIQVRRGGWQALGTLK